MKIVVIEKSANRDTQYIREIKNKSTKYKGVYLKKERKKYPYVVKGCYQNKCLHIGCYETPEIGAKIYDLFAKRFINKPQLNENIYPDLSNLTLDSTLVIELENRFIVLEQQIQGLKYKNPPRFKKKNIQKIKLPRKTKFALTIEVISKEMLEDYIKKGINYTDIANKYDISLNLLNRVLSYYNIKRYKLDRTIVKLHLETKELLITLLNSFFSIEEASLSLNCNTNTLKLISKRYGINYKDYLKKNSIQCPICKTIHFSSITTKIYCSEHCRKKAETRRLHPRKEHYIKTCKYCGKQFKTYKLSVEHCSISCKYPKKKQEYYTHTCLICGKLYISTYNESTYCSVKCQHFFKEPNKNISNKAVNEVRVCVYCGTYFTVKSYKKNKYCSRLCGAKDYMEKTGTNTLWSKIYKNTKTRVRKIQDKLRSTLRMCYKASRKRNGKVYKKLENRLNLFGIKVCCFCNNKLEDSTFTIEHLYPYSLNKEKFNYLNNIFCSCRSCNESKSDLDWKEWFKKQIFYSKEREDQIVNFNHINIEPAIRNKKKKST